MRITLCFIVATSLYLSGCSHERIDWEKKRQLKVAHYTQTLARNPGDSSALINRASAYYDLNRYDEAMKDCNRFLELYPSVGTAYVLRGCVFYQVGGDSNVAAAMVDWRKAIALNRSYSAAYGNIAQLFSDKEDWDSALAYYSISLELEPNDTLVLYGRAKAFRLLDRYEEAADDLTKALKINPRFTKALYLSGVYRFIDEDYARSAQELRQYIDLAGKGAHPQAHFTLGYALEMLGRATEAEEQFERTLEKDSTHDLAMLRLAGIYDKRGDAAKAMQYYNAFLKVTDQNDTIWTNYIKERLAALAKK